MNLNSDDYELVREFLSGNQQAFNKIARKYQEKIYWHARRMLGDHDDAHEVVQQVLLVMYNKLNTFNFSSSLFTWIYRVTHTRSLNELKRRKVRSILTFSTDEIVKDEGFENIVEGMENREKLMQVEKALKSLPTRQREVFVMRNFDELSYDEISEITGKSVGALKANYFHAFKKVKELLDKNDE